MIDKQILVSIFLNAATILMSLACLNSEFVSFTSYKITLRGIINNVNYEDVHGDVYASFSAFESFACRKSHNPGILTVCGNILNFETSGIILQIGSYLSILFNVFSIYSYLQRKAYSVSHFLSIAVYLCASLTYLLFNSKDILDPEDASVVLVYDTGCFLLFLTNMLQLVTVMHFSYASKLQNLHYKLFMDSSMHEHGLVEGENREDEQNRPLSGSPEAILEGQAKELKKLQKENQMLVQKVGNGDDEVLGALNELRGLLEKVSLSSDPENQHGAEVVERIQSNINGLFEKVDNLAQKKWRNERKSYEDEIEKLLGEVEKTKRYLGMDENKLQMEVYGLETEKKNLSEKCERVSKENLEMKANLNKAIVQAETRLEETERQKKILENNKLLLIEKQLKIEDLEKTKRYLENKDKNLTESSTEQKKYLKEYEELMIQLKKDKDELTRQLKARDSDLETMQTQFYTVRTESQSLKSALALDPSYKPSIFDIETESLKSQLFNCTESLKKTKEDLAALEDKHAQAVQDNETIGSKLKDCIQDYQSSLNKIYDLESTIREDAEVKLKYTKALDEINDLSTILESFRKEAGDSKITEDKSIYIDKYSKKKEKIRELKKQLESANRKLKNVSKSLDATEKLAEQEIQKARESANEAYQKLHGSEEEWERIKAELVHTSAQQTRELEIIQSRMKTQEEFFEKELQSCQLSLESSKDECKRQQIQSDYFKAEHENLQILEKALALPENLEGIKAAIAETTQRSEENIRAYEAQLDKLLAEKEKLRKKLQQTEADLQQASEECQQLHKMRFENRRSDTISFSSIDSSSRSIQDSLIIEGISPSIIFHNPLLERIGKLRKEPPMTYSAVWKTLELLMQEKLKADKIDLEIGRAPRNVADYMFEFMYKQYGLKTLGLKQLKALIVSLEELYKLTHPYSVFFCRVLGIFHPRPVPVKVCAYLFAIQDQFNQLTQKVKTKPESFPEQYEIMQFGGEASIADLVDLIKKVFKKYRAAGERILDTLHRDQPDRLEISLLKVCSSLQKQGKTDDYIFESLTTESAGLDYQEFIDGIRDTLDIWITQEDAEQLCSLFDEGNSGVITLASWRQKVRFEEFCEKIYSKAAMVSKADFLNSLLSEYEFEALEDYHELKRVIKAKEVSPDQASEYLVQIDSSLNIDAQERIFKEALVHDGGHGKAVSSEALCIVVLKHCIGGYGKGLFQLELLQEALASIS